MGWHRWSTLVDLEGETCMLHSVNLSEKLGKIRHPSWKSQTERFMRHAKSCKNSPATWEILTKHSCKVWMIENLVSHKFMNPTLLKQTGITYMLAIQQTFKLKLTRSCNDGKKCEEVAVAIGGPPVVHWWDCTNHRWPPWNRRILRAWKSRVSFYFVSLISLCVFADKRSVPFR